MSLISMPLHHTMVLSSTQLHILIQSRSFGSKTSLFFVLFDRLVLRNIIISFEKGYIFHGRGYIILDILWFITNRRRLLQISDGIENPDGLVWELVLSLAIAWLLVYFSVWKGVKVTGKVSCGAQFSAWLIAIDCWHVDCWHSSNITAVCTPNDSV